MYNETSLSAAVSITDKNAEYNEYAKRILSEKIILAHILVQAVPEFEYMTPEEAVALIEGKPEVSGIPVNPGETNMPHIRGVDTNDTVPHEGTVTFDIRFDVNYPKGKETIKLLIGIEAQKKYNPGYDIVTRGIFYGARMISSQLETEFHNSDYDNVKKVYSIWICMNVPQYAENTITAYEIKKRNIVGEFPEGKTRYDLLSVIVICLSQKLADESNELKLHRLLGTLFSSQLEVEEKKAILTDEYHIPMNEELERSVNSMCNLAEGIAEEAEKIGVEKGKEIGERKGGVLALNKVGFSVEKIAEELNIPIQEVKDILEISYDS